jgi:hypothetical protein
VHLHTNVHLSFITKVGASQIFNRLRGDEKPSISFLPSTEAGVRLGDMGVSQFTGSETIACGRVSCLSFLRSEL